GGRPGDEFSRENCSKFGLDGSSRGDLHDDRWRATMPDVAIATNHEDAAAAERIVAHHAELTGKLTVLVTAATQASSAQEARAARDRLVTWARSELMPHAEAEERSLYRAGGAVAELKVLIPAMVAEHRVIDELIG